MTDFLDTPSGRRIAYHRTDGQGTGIVFLGGFMSDMEGTKAVALQDWAKAQGRPFLRFDYSGHGQSDGKFVEGCIGEWAADAQAAIEALTDGPQVLVGSSMGGWISLLCALVRPQRVPGLVLLAPAPDFTEKLMWARFGEAEKRQILEGGSWTRPSPYDEDGYPITRSLIEDGAKWSILDDQISFDGPVRILHGALDTDVPPDHSRQLVDKLSSPDVVWTLIKDGDHRLSRAEDINRLIRETLALADQLDAASA